MTPEVQKLMEVGLDGLVGTSQAFADEVGIEAGFQHPTIAHLISCGFQTGAVWMLEQLPGSNKDLIDQLWEKVATRMQADFDKLTEEDP